MTDADLSLSLGLWAGWMCAVLFGVWLGSLIERRRPR